MPFVPTLQSACYTLVVWWCLLFAVGAQAAPPAAGTIINNQATGEFVDPGRAAPNKFTLVSNRVEVTVMPVASARLDNDGLIETTPGSSVLWQHTLTNTGNIDDTYTLTLADAGGDSGAFTSVVLVHDRNGNGFRDAADVVIPVGGPLTLAPGVAASLLVLVQTPADAQEGDRFLATLTAVSGGGARLTRTDEAQIVGPSLELTKQVSAPTAKQGDVLSYSLTIRNRNRHAVAPTLINLDGAELPRILMSDPVPANVSLRARPVYAGPGTLMYHLAETPDHRYVTVLPADPALVDRIGIAYETFAGFQTDALVFEVTVLANAAQTTLTNQFQFLHRLGDRDQADISPQVQTVVSEAGKTPTLVNKDSDYAELDLRIGLGDQLFLEANCSACNTLSGRRDYLVIRVRSGNNSKNDGVRNAPLLAFYDANGMDEVIVTAYETGPNTGVFHVVAFGEDTSKTVPIGIPTRNYEGGAVDKSDNRLETLRQDILIANILYCLEPDLTHGQDVNVSARVLVDPFGVVFDSTTNLPVAGTEVTLVQMVAGREVLATVFDDNGRVCSSPTLPRDKDAAPDCLGLIITGADGKYRFPLVDPGDYVLKIKPPVTHTFPSNVAIPAIFRRVVVTGSRGEIFNVSPLQGPVEIDVPLDPQTVTAALFVRKTGNRTQVEIGEFVDYTVVVRNAGLATATAVKMEDRMPGGFSYVPRSAQVDSVAMEPVLGGGLIRFDLGSLAGGVEKTIRYRLRAGAVSRTGTAVNQAAAFEDVPGGLRSNVAAYSVRVVPGVFTAEGYITGKIYADCNRSGVQDAEEVGVPGVRFFLEDGTYVVTDVEGKFDFYGLRPKTHILKLDRTTLPRGLELIEQSVRHGGDPVSRFVDLKPSEIHRADFAVTDGTAVCDGPAMQEIFQRRADGDGVIGELERNLKVDLPVVPVVISDVRSLPVSGCLAGNEQQCGTHGKAQLPELSAVIAAAPRKVTRKRSPELESYLADADRTAAILNFKEGEILPSSQTAIQVKGPSGAVFVLTVNGRELPFTRVGKRITVQDSRVEAREYIGINMDYGNNRIELKLTDPMGNPRGEAVVNVVAPGKLEAVKLLASQTTLEANGENTLPMSLILHDRDGVPVTSRTQVTVEASAGRIQEDDLDPKQPGTQLFVEGGEATVTLVAPVKAGEGEVTVRTGVLKESVKVRFVPELRPMVAAGIIEGMISLKDFDTGRVTPAMAADGFEDELGSLASGKDGKLNSSGRAALFLKGKVKGEYLLTLSYDSDKDKNQSLFRDIRPEEYYPVYGDSAVKGFDAQSTGKLYVRVDKGRSYALFGDYNTRIDNAGALELGQYSRSLTGARARFENERSQATVFVAQTESNQITLEIPALGVSGPYALPGINGLLVNSEKVEILLRDRNNPGLILSARTVSRFSDYEFEPLTGALIFKSPVPSLDPDLNPFSIRVTLEVDSNGPDYWVGGAQGQHRLTERLTVGASAVSEENPTDAYRLGSVNASYKLTADTRVVVEGAASDRESKGVGAAGRIEVIHEKGGDYWRVFHSESESAFDNTAAPISAGRAESGGRLRLNLNRWGMFRAEASRTEDGSNSGVRQGVKLSLEKKLNDWLSMEVGSRIYDETRAPASSGSLGVTPYEGVTAWAKANGRIPGLTGASAYLEYEQDLQAANRQVMAVGGDYRLGTQGRVYARHEFISSLTGGNGLNDQQERDTTVVGMEDEYMKDGRVFSEYRVRDAISAAEAEAAIGLRNRWYLAEAIRLSTNLERVTTLKGNDGNDATAVSLGLEYLANPLWKATGKIDFRWADTADTILNQLGLAWKMNRDWTLLTRNTFSLTDNKTAGNKVLDRFQLGFAWRQVDTNRWDALTKLEYRLEDDRSVKNLAVERTAAIFSTHVNYHPVRRWTFAGNYAVKQAEDDSLGLASDSLTQMVGLRAIHDLTERWEASVQGGVILDERGQQRYVAGLESGYMVMSNFWLSAGYNFLSYDDGELAGNDYTADGVYLRFRFKFDEDLFNARKPGINKTLEPDHVRP